ncbi:hypothetical protein Vau01_034180 [Virgisporangium aurantiacum]|uniref:Uncharacterized protein n=1 Tax=Virgisporangium aurantiacum TaxID=175570 RepID=A0A8J4E1D6_9ACTN|nr:hypothetical protein Vau01_034180 [Virgisporangium aurantiacum]
MRVPSWVSNLPFVGADAIAAGLLTKRQLTGETWLRLFPTVYAWRESPLDHRTWCVGAGLFLCGRSRRRSRACGWC